jgi:hypothetical protein
MASTPSLRPLRQPEFTLPRHVNPVVAGSIQDAVAAYVSQRSTKPLTAAEASSLRRVVTLVPCPAPSAVRALSPEAAASGPFTHYVPIGTALLKHRAVVEGGWLEGRTAAQVVKGVAAVLQAGWAPGGAGGASAGAGAGGAPLVFPGVLLSTRQAASASAGVGGGAGGGAKAGGPGAGGGRGRAPTKPEPVLLVRCPGVPDVILSALQAMVCAWAEGCPPLMSHSH